MLAQSERVDKRGLGLDELSLSSHSGFLVNHSLMYMSLITSEMSSTHDNHTWLAFISIETDHREWNFVSFSCNTQTYLNAFVLSGYTNKYMAMFKS